MAVGIQIIDGDIAIDNAGKLVDVQGSRKCARDFGKMLQTATEFTGNETTYYRYNPTYGTELDRKSAYIGLSRKAVLDMINFLVNQAVTRYISLQESRTNLDVEEIINSVNFITVYDINDPTLAKCRIFVTLSNGETIIFDNLTQQVS